MTTTSFDLYKEFRSEITYEANLISQRMGWFITTQSLLLATLVFSSNRTAGNIVAFKGGVLFPEIAIVAFFLGLLTIRSVWESYDRADRYRKKIITLITNREGFELQVLYTDRRKRSVSIGKFSTITIPLLFLVVWGIIIVNNCTLVKALLFLSCS